jgi:hypothetical protein
MSDSEYKGLLQTHCEELVEQSMDPALWEGDDFNRGRLSMLHQILLALDSDVRALGIDRSKIALDSFDVGEWFRLGPEYFGSTRT